MLLQQLSFVLHAMVSHAWNMLVKYVPPFVISVLVMLAYCESARCML